MSTEPYASNIVAFVTHDDFDPWSSYSDDHDGRVSYYPVPHWPSCFVDGLVEQYPGNFNGLATQYNNRIDVESPIGLQVFSYEGDGEAIVLVIVNSADEAVTGNNKLRCALLSNGVTGWYSGNNGQNDFHNDLLTYSPDHEGVDFEIDENSTEVYTFTFDYPIILLDGQDTFEILPENLTAIAFVQNDNTEEVINAEKAAFDNLTFATTQHFAHLTRAGESAVFEFDLENFIPQDNAISVEVTSDLPEGWTYVYTTPDGDMTENGTINLGVDETYTSTFTVQTTDNMDVYDGTFTFTFSSEHIPGYEASLTFYTGICDDVLLVNNVPGGMYSEYYTQSLDAVITAGASNYSVWDNSMYMLDAMDLASAVPEAAIWFTGGEGIMTEEDVAALVSYLEAGGNLWITGSNAPANMANSTLIEMMGAAYQQEYPAGIHAEGEEGDPIGNGLSFDIGGGDGADNRGVPTSITISGGEVSLWYSMVRRAGVRNETDTYKTLLLGFPFEAIADVDSRNQLMVNWINYAFDLTSVDHDQQNVIPASYSLEQNYPNPFNPTTDIAFSLPGQADVTITVFDLNGREVTRLLSADKQAGYHTVSWDAQGFASGIYFYKMEAEGAQGSYSELRRMVLLK